jgi:hypothetical protein
MSLSEGERRLNMYVAIARKLQGIPVEERPWNVTKGMTAGLDNLATGILNDEDIFDEDYPTKEKLAKTTIITLLKDMRERSVDAAKTYEEAVKDINRPAGKYTLATSKNDEEVIELGSVSDKVNLKVRTFVDCLVPCLTLIIAGARLPEETDRTN